jgi:phenylalanyl-tRNA synthetase beta chain
MKVSCNWLADWVDLDGFKHPREIADLLTARGLEVEGLKQQNEGLEKVISVQIIAKDKHPEADRLSICKVNPGNNQYLDIVCGAQNMKVGDVVALAQVGSELPNGMKISAGKIRGVVSNGMLCSETELGLKDTSDGILILPEKTPVGWLIADVLNLNDTIFEIKLTANRGDCLSHRGLAREIAAAIGKPLKKLKIPMLPFDGCSMNVSLDAGSDAPQFCGAMMTGVKVTASPAWLRSRLEVIGQRSINNLVDVSNYLMFDIGFPVHIYDAEKIEGQKIQVRRAKAGESLPLLDGVTIETGGEELLITDANKPIGLAGVMGGGNSEVTEATKRIFLECAAFNPTLVRRSAFRHQRRSEASLRFEKGIDPTGHREAISRLADLVTRVAPAFVEGSVAVSSEQKINKKSIVTTVDWINEFLGTKIEEATMLKILKSLDCEVMVEPAGRLMITAPAYRLDLSIPEDIAEEVARCVGYDSIPATIPVLTGLPKLDFGNAKSHRLQLLDELKDSLAGQGLSEVLTYAFQSDDALKKLGFHSTVQILNPLSEEQAMMVPSLLPGILKAYQENERHHFGSEPLAVRLFEVRPVFSYSADGPIQARSEMETGITETWKCSVLMSGPRYDQAMKSERGEVDFFDLKAVLEESFDRLGTKGIRYRSVPLDHPLIKQGLFHSGQCIEVSAGKESIGVFGRIHPQLENDLKIRTPIFWGELNLEPVMNLTTQRPRSFKAWSTHPTMERDFALLVQDTVTAENLLQSALKHGKPIAKVVKIFDTYKGASIPEGMVSLGVRVIFSDETKSLEEKQVDLCAETIVKKWESEFKATLR